METKLTTDMHRRTYLLTWGDQELDVRPYPYSRTGRQYQPTSARVDVYRQFDGAWEVFAERLYGGALKKDGSVGLQRVEERFWSTGYNDTRPIQLQEAAREILAFLNDPAVKG